MPDADRTSSALEKYPFLTRTIPKRQPSHGPSLASAPRTDISFPKLPLFLTFHSHISPPSSNLSLSPSSPSCSKLLSRSFSSALGIPNLLLLIYCYSQPSQRSEMSKQ